MSTMPHFSPMTTLHARPRPLSALMLAGAAGLTPAATSWAQAPAPQTETVLELPTVQVRADADKPDGMRASNTRVGKKSEDPHDVPQAITSVTQALMNEQQVGSLKEALRNVAGLSFNAAEGGRSGDNMNLRGFYTFGDMYLDGIRDTAQYNRETFNLEQIDVLRGAGAMLFGRGQAGGVINQVSKTPLRYEQTQLSASVGTDHYAEATADVNKPLSDTAALRINALQRDEGSWRSNPSTGTEPEVHRKGLAASLALNQGSNDPVWLNYYRLETKDNPDYGVAFDPATRAPGSVLAASDFFGNDNTFDQSTTENTTLVNEHRLSPQSTLRTQLRVARYDRSYWAKTPSLATEPDALAGVGGNQTRSAHYQTTTLQSDYNSRFRAFGMPHEIVSGFEYLKEGSSRNSLQNFGTSSAPDYRPYQESLTSKAATFSSDSYAVYAQDSVEFIPHWKATAGIRRDLMNASYSSATSPQLQYGENSYRTALSYQPDDETHYYVAWSNSFSPTADLYQQTVTALPPETSEVAEIGAKWLLLEGDLALRAALYQATKYWERSADLESTAAILTKKRQTNGLELEAAGRVTDRLQVFAGLALMDARILEVAQNVNASTGALTSANPDYAGKTARNTPPYTLNLWSDYQVSSRWTLGGGLEAKGERQAFNPSSTAAVPTLNGSYYPNTAPAYVRWDAMARYEWSKWTMRVNVKNVMDRLYYDAVYDNGAFTVAGPRRTLIVTAETHF